MTGGCQPFGDFDTPFPRHLPGRVSPFTAGIFLCPEGLRLSVNDRPCESSISHSILMGQIVPSVKDDVSPALKKLVGHNRPMSEWLSQAAFEAELRARIAALRDARGWTQKQMATALGVPVEAYKKYENRVGSVMPSYLIPRFAQFVDRDVAYILTGAAADAKRRGPRALADVSTNG